jgi:hypothetical protein
MFSTTLISSSDNLTRKHPSFGPSCLQTHLRAKTKGEAGAVELRKSHSKSGQTDNGPDTTN